MHILPFPGDELPPSALPLPPSAAASTLTLTRLLHGAVTAKRHALSPSSAQQPQPPPAAVPWKEDHAEEEEEEQSASPTTTAPAPAAAAAAGGYCPCFGGKVCPREKCEWREALPGAVSMGGRSGRVREEMVRCVRICTYHIRLPVCRPILNTVPPSSHTLIHTLPPC